MNTMVENNTTHVMLPAEITELVRGTDHLLVARIAPMVQQCDVAVDFSHIRRIDAAGIAALITLFHCARQSGHTFAVCHVAPRIDEILRLVGLEDILVCHEIAENRPDMDACFEHPAA